MGKFTDSSKPTNPVKVAKREKIKKPKVLDLDGETSTSEAKPASDEAKRDFAGDMSAYVKVWRNDREAWKFSKVLQNWLLDNAFKSEKIDKQLFHDCLPYIGSIMGGARTRLLERCDKYLSDGLEEDDIHVRRAKKIHHSFAKNDEDKER